MVRIKVRYILVRVQWFDGGDESGRPETGKVLLIAIREGVGRLFGEFGRGCLRSLAVKYWSRDTGAAIVRVPRERVRMALAALSLVTAVGGRHAAVRVVHVGGSLLLCSKAAIRQGRDFLAAFNPDETTPVPASSPAPATATAAPPAIDVSSNEDEEAML